MTWLNVIIVAFAAMLPLVAARGLRTRAHHRQPAPLPREPRDTARPVLRDVADLEDPADPRLSVCPVCGMDGDEITLDGTFSGAWPAHQTCMWWLGDWAPPDTTPAVPRRVPPEALEVLAELRAIETFSGYRRLREQVADALGIKGTEVDRQLSAAIRAGKVKEGGTGTLAAQMSEGQDWVLQSFGVPRVIIAQPPAPVTEWCICGQKFSGARPVVAACPLHPHPRR